MLNGVAHAGGADIFSAHCAICHQPNAGGVPGMYPPLASSIGAYVNVPEGRAYLVHVVAFGLTGAISVHGQTYVGLMQSWPGLSDEEIAQVLNYILTNFNSKLIPKHCRPLTAGEVAKYRASSVSIGDLLKQRAALLKSINAAPGGS
jgi:mono/diheme cytochrome c family protein